ncbi:hypothetical protein [Actinomadura rudentiformis]|uniref:hypothetical protein n=1 Tax=Actinomadura rudentiformis TaxID=359158 RepID=UPI00178C7199|nr:hypothetical protein [Actinomadura rudentiformis]
MAARTQRHQDDPDKWPALASAVHRTLLTLRVPRFMADYTAALLAAHLKERRRPRDK